jgi:hypothetical protein
MIEPTATTEPTPTTPVIAPTTGIISQTGLIASASSRQTLYEFFTSLGIWEWWGIVLTLSAMGTLALILLWALIRNTLGVWLSSQIVVSSKPVRSDEFLIRQQGNMIQDQLYLVEEYSKNLVTLSNKDGMIFGQTSETAIKEGLYLVSGEKSALGQKECIVISKLVPYKSS